MSELAHKSIQSLFRSNNSRSFACHSFDHICQEKNRRQNCYCEPGFVTTVLEAASFTVRSTPDFRNTN